ncbi:hypothetical protein JHK85_012951 [Glycine max]|nr:hypothetical protein JHK85_012951 [Glycine max]
MELYANMTSCIVGNFHALYIDEKGIRQSGKPLHYKGSSFHRVISSFMCQGGHFTAGKELTRGKLGREEQDRANHGGGGGSGLCVTILVTDLVDGSATPTKAGVNRDVWCLETEDVGRNDIKGGEH